MTDDRYTGGRSTPRPVRFNDLLWSDFARFAKRRGMTAADALRRAMIETLDKHDAATLRKTSSVHIEPLASLPRDIIVEVDLG